MVICWFSSERRGASLETGGGCTFSLILGSIIIISITILVQIWEWFWMLTPALTVNYCYIKLSINTTNKLKWLSTKQLDIVPYFPNIKRSLSLWNLLNWMCLNWIFLTLILSKAYLPNSTLGRYLYCNNRHQKYLHWVNLYAALEINMQEIIYTGHELIDF